MGDVRIMDDMRAVRLSGGPFAGTIIQRSFGDYRPVEVVDGSKGVVGHYVRESLSRATWRATEHTDTVPTDTGVNDGE